MNYILSVFKKSHPTYHFTHWKSSNIWFVKKEYDQIFTLELLSSWRVKNRWELLSSWRAKNRSLFSTVCGARLGDDTMDVQDIRARLAGILTDGVGGSGGIRSVFSITRAPMETLHQLDAAVDFILSLSPASPSKVDSRNPPPRLSPRLIQICTVCKMTACGIPRPVSNMTVCGKRLGDDAMGVQVNRGRLAGMLPGGGGGGGGSGGRAGGWGGGGEGGAAGWGWGAVDTGCVESLLDTVLSRVMRALVSIPAVATASVSHSAAVGGSVVGVEGFL